VGRNEQYRNRSDRGRAVTFFDLIDKHAEGIGVGIISIVIIATMFLFVVFVAGKADQ
jgi:hypothetical protein